MGFGYPVPVKDLSLGQQIRFTHEGARITAKVTGLVLAGEDVDATEAFVMARLADGSGMTIKRALSDEVTLRYRQASACPHD